MFVNNRNCFLIILEAGKSITVLAGTVSGEHSLARSLFSKLCPDVVEGPLDSLDLLDEALTPQEEGSSSMTCLFPPNSIVSSCGG